MLQTRLPPPNGGARVLLVGAGHAHLHVLRHGRPLVQAGHQLVVVDPGDFWYSGGAAAVLAGIYPPDLDRVDVDALAARVGAVRLRDRMVGADPERREVRLASGDAVSWDVLSLNVGSVVAHRVDGSADHAVGVKPIPALLDLAGVIRAGAVRESPLRVVVMGGGPSGCEVALALRRRAEREGAAVRITLVTVEDVLEGFPAGAARSMRKVLTGRGVELVEGVPVRAARPEAVVLGDGSTLPSDLTVAATGLVPPPFLAELGLPVGPEGGLVVDEHLRSPGHPRVFGAGDCIRFGPRTLPRVGVYAVRQAPVLLGNIRAVLTGRPLRRFEPQSRYLLILALGDGTGLAVRGPFHYRGRAAFRLKDFLDRRFLRAHDPSAALPAADPEMPE